MPEDLPEVKDILAKTSDYYMLPEADAEKIFARILTAEHEKIISLRPSRKRKYYWPVAAAVTFLLITVGVVLHTYHSNEHIIQKTNYGEITTLALPDGSTVTLNGNSYLEYTTEWHDEPVRAVKLEGEAFFSVVHTQDNRSFIVRTNDDFSIEVLGTRFNVLHRKGKAEVVLNEGKVKVNIRKDSTTEHITMKPGEAITFEETTKALARAKVVSENRTAWKNAKLVLDNTSLKEVIERMEETYGVAVQVTDKKLLAQRLWGSVPANNVDVLLKGIETSFGLTIRRQDNTIVIDKPKPKRYEE